MNPRPYILALLALVGLALTPFYSLAFLIAIVYVSLWNPWRNTMFASYVVRLFSQFLIFNSLLMLVGMYCWFAGISVPPLLVVAVYLLIYWFVRRQLPGQKSNWGTYDDWLALGLSLAGIVILLACFYLPKPTLADSIRLITNGYDNTAHLSLIETTYRAGGYVYGHYQQIKEQVAWSTLTAYPQGWHLANALWWKGTGTHPFDGSKIGLRINLYIFTLLIWQLCAAFLFTRIGLFVSELFGLGKRLRQPGMAIGFGAGVLMLQMIIFWGTAFYGFTPFIGAVNYLLLILAMLIAIFADKRENKYLGYFVMLIAAGALTMAWLLPAPLVLLMIALTFGSLTSWRAANKYIVDRRRTIFITILASLLILIPILAQVAINHLYSTEGSNQIDDNGGIFGLSSGLVLLVFSFTTYTMLSVNKREQALSRAYLIAAAPILLGVLFIYAYQMATLGKTVYFFIKMSALLLVIVGPFFVAAFIKLLDKLKFDMWPQTFTASFAVLSIGTIIAFTGQPIFNFTSLLNRSVLSNATSKQLAMLANSGQLINEHVLVFTGRPSPDLQGSVFSTSMPLHFDSCVAGVEWAVVNEPSVTAEKTSQCTAKGEHFFFVTSSATENIIKGMHNSNVRAVIAN